MAKRYRYAFAQQKQAKEGVFSVALAGISFLLFLMDILISFLCEGKTPVTAGAIVGGISIFAILLSAYGFVWGVKSFSEENRSHIASLIGAVTNGMITVGWLALFLFGV